MDGHSIRNGAYSVALCLLAACVVIPSRSAAQEIKPNIIFIMADDLGYGDLGCYGQKLIRTPRIDRMATQGTRFAHCYAGAAVCAPSRNVLMTGQHTGHTTVRNNSPRIGGIVEVDSTDGARRLPIKAGDITVAEVLHGANYATGITGKWGLGEPDTDGIPTRQGFDEWLGYLNQNHAPDYFTTFLWRNEKRLPLAGNVGGKRGQYAHDLFTEFSLDFIRKNRERPFFLYVAYTIPHRKFEVPDTAPYTGESWAPEAKIYAAMITRMDRDVGRILDLVAELGLDERTIIFFTSDNGAEGKRGFDWGPMFNSWSGMRGQKGTPYEGGIRAPMVVRWPGRVPAGRVSDAPWYFADFLPTAADLAGVKPPAKIDGVSVLPTLLGRGQDLSSRFLYWEIFKGNEGDLAQVVRHGDFKAVRLLPEGTLELYDLSTDPTESRNVASEHPRVVERTVAYLRTARTPSPNWPVRGDKE